MNDQDILGEIDRGVLGAADSLPYLFVGGDSGEAVEPRRLRFARRATATVEEVADLPAIANAIFGMAGGEYCRFHYGNLSRIIIAFCPRHSNMPVRKFPERYLMPSWRVRRRLVLDYLSRMYGHTREVTCVTRQPFLPVASVVFAAFAPCLTVDSALRSYDDL